MRIIYWEPLYTKILFFALLLLVIIFPIKIWRWLGKILLFSIGLPYHIWKWRKKKKLAKIRQENYEYLGNYITLFADYPDILRYLRNLIENNIEPLAFQNIITSNLKNIELAQLDLQKKEIQQQLQEELEFKKLAAERQELLVQSRMSLEQIKFREQLLDNLYQKIKKKYDKL